MNNAETKNLKDDSFEQPLSETMIDMQNQPDVNYESKNNTP